MAIAFDSASVGSNWASFTTSLSWSITVAAGSDKKLIVLAFMSNDFITGVTFNGVALTQDHKFNSSAGWHYTYYLDNPASTTANVVISIGSGGAGCFGVAGVWTGMAAGGHDSVGTNSGIFVTSLTTSTTVVANGSWGILNLFSNKDPSPGTGSVLAREQANDGEITLALYHSNADLAPGSRSMQATTGAATNLYGVMTSWAPAAGGGGGDVTLGITGVSSGSTGGGSGILTHPGMSGGMRGYKSVPDWAKRIPEMDRQLRRAA